MKFEDPALEAWFERFDFVTVGDHRVAYADIGRNPVKEEAKGEPEALVVLHGFPTSSFDFAHLADRWAEHRRVVFVDFLGFGFSDKPDIAYSMATQADAVTGVLASLNIDRFALLTHDMGDTVGGELLARHIDKTWPVEITRRIISNGSIYIAMANLTGGQQMLLSLPDEVPGSGPGRELVAASLAATLADPSIDMSAHAEAVCYLGGDAMMARTVRYIEERRTNERRFTGAIESHPSPLTVIWGMSDPIAVPAMVEKLSGECPDAEIVYLEDVGHYPMIEDPDRFLTATELALRR